MKKKLLVIITSVLLVISCTSCIVSVFLYFTDKRWDKEHEKYLKTIDVFVDTQNEVKAKKEELEKIKEENKEKVEELESWKKEVQKVTQG